MELSTSTQACLLLTTRLSARDASEVLTAEQFSLLREKLGEENSISLLLEGNAEAVLCEYEISAKFAKQIMQLLSRGVGLAIATEKWSRTGVWIVGCEDPEYPLSIQSCGTIPPVIFGYGSLELLDGGGVIVDESLETKFGLNDLATVIDGLKTSAVGILDLVRSREILVELLQRGGQAVGITYKDLVAYGSVEQLRRAVLGGRLVLVSSRPPGHQMKDKPIYEEAIKQAIGDPHVTRHAIQVLNEKESEGNDPPTQQLDLGF